MIQTSSRISMTQSQELCGFFREQFISKDKQVSFEDSNNQETNINVPVEKLKKLTTAQRKICFNALQNIENAKLEDFRPKKIGKEEDKKSSKVKEKEIDLDEKEDKGISKDQEKLQTEINNIKKILSESLSLEDDEIHFKDEKTNKIKKKFQAIVKSITSFVKGVFVAIYNFVTRQVSAESLKKKMIKHCKNAQTSEAIFKKNELTLQELAKKKNEKTKQLKQEVVLQNKQNEIVEASANCLNNIAKGECREESFNGLLKKLYAINGELNSFYEDALDAKESYDSEQADKYGLSSLNRFIKNFSEENELLEYKYNEKQVKVESFDIF